MIAAMKMPMFSTSQPLRRVRRDEIKQDTWIKPDGLDHCLECWKAWMQKDDTDLGMQLQKSLTGKGSYGDGDSESAGDGYASAMRVDNEVAEATDAMVRSLQTSHQWAIKKKCGISTVWRFNNLDFMNEAQDACAALTTKLKNNSTTKPFF